MENYNVGYGKPPKSGQFKPGFSGNKKGRPKGNKNVQTILMEILNGQIIIKEGEKTYKMTKLQAILTQLTNKAMKGDIRASQIILAYIIAFDVKNEERDKILAVLHTNDKKIINEFLERSRQLSNTPDEEDVPEESKNEELPDNNDICKSEEAGYDEL